MSHRHLKVVVLISIALYVTQKGLAYGDTIGVGDTAQKLVLKADASSALTPWTILTATAGLIAFQIGLYTLVARERKSPYIINSVYSVFLLCLAVAATALSTVFVPAWIGNPVLYLSAALLTVTFVISAFRVFRITVRSIYFVDTVHLKHWPGIRDLRRWIALLSPKPNYAHDMIPIPDDLRDEIEGVLLAANAGTFEVRGGLDPLALAVALQHQGQGNRVLAQLAELFLKRKYSVQYLTASRHPIEFILYLKKHLETQKLIWKECSRLVVVIDAYSPHFAFLDSIYVRKNRELEALGITNVRSKMTYAGMHTAASRAFKVIQQQASEDNNRRPTLVIYEDTYALTDLESAEQYRIFVRHVMPSERLWGAMFTVFVESFQADSDWKLLQSYASMYMDFRKGGVTDHKPSIGVPNSTGSLPPAQPEKRCE